MTRTIPERVRWAVATLDVDPADRILELGSGPGAAISLVCERLDGGTITAIDRSPVQVARALERNREHVAAGKASVRIEELERLSVATTASTRSSRSTSTTSGCTRRTRSWTLSGAC